MHTLLPLFRSRNRDTLLFNLITMYNPRRDKAHDEEFPSRNRDTLLFNCLFGGSVGRYQKVSISESRYFVVQRNNYLGSIVINSGFPSRNRDTLLFNLIRMLRHFWRRQSFDLGIEILCCSTSMTWVRPWMRFSFDLGIEILCCSTARYRRSFRMCFRPLLFRARRFSIGTEIIEKHDELAQSTAL